MPRATESNTTAEKPLAERRPARYSASLNKHQQRTEATKAKLLQAALRIFTRDGFEAARIDDIASEAGYTRGAFYAHFGSKEDLFFAMVEDQSNKHMQRIQKALGRCTTDASRLQTLREYYVMRVADRQWSILTLEFKLYALRHPKLRAKLAEMHRSIRMKIKWEGLESILPAALMCAPQDEAVLKVTLHAILHGLVLESAYDPASISEAKVKVQLRRLFDLLLTK